jgi:hypothetical protein
MQLRWHAMQACRQGSANSCDDGMLRSAVSVHGLTYACIYIGMGKQATLVGSCLHVEHTYLTC